MKRNFLEKLKELFSFTKNEIKEAKIPEVKLGNEELRLQKLQILRKVLEQGNYTAVEKYLSRVYNIRRHGDYYSQDYFYPENTHGRVWSIDLDNYIECDEDGWIENIEIISTLFIIIKDIESYNISPITKISIKEIRDKFDLNDINPGLIKVVKNKYTEHGFKPKNW